MHCLSSKYLFPKLYFFPFKSSKRTKQFDPITYAHFRHDFLNSVLAYELIIKILMLTVHGEYFVSDILL